MFPDRLLYTSKHMLPTSNVTAAPHPALSPMEL